jgi:hypothetical protein
MDLRQYGFKVMLRVNIRNIRGQTTATPKVGADETAVIPPLAATAWRYAPMK